MSESLNSPILFAAIPKALPQDRDTLTINHLADSIISLHHHAAVDVRLCTDVYYRTRYQLEHAVCLLSLRSTDHHLLDGGRHCLGGVTTPQSKRATPMRLSKPWNQI